MQLYFRYITLEGRHDDIPERAFYFAGGIEEIRQKTLAGNAGSCG